MSILYIGIDDTDNLDTRGTGYHARQLMNALSDATLAQPIGVTRHQLWFNDQVPYTSHNSSACLIVETNSETSSIIAFCRTFLLKIAAEGSDVGLCVANVQQSRQFTNLGLKAKRQWVSQSEVSSLAQQNQSYLEGLTGDHQGIVGALSAVGLFADGNDGRYIWSNQLREHTHQQVTLADLTKWGSLDKAVLTNLQELRDPTAIIELGEWPRTVRLNHQSVLLVEQSNEHRFKVVDKDTIKSFRP